MSITAPDSRVEFLLCRLESLCALLVLVIAGLAGLAAGRSHYVSMAPGICGEFFVLGGTLLIQRFPKRPVLDFLSRGLLVCVAIASLIGLSSLAALYMVLSAAALFSLCMTDRNRTVRNWAPVLALGVIVGGGTTLLSYLYGTVVHVHDGVAPISMSLPTASAFILGYPLGFSRHR